MPGGLSRPRVLLADDHVWMRTLIAGLLGETCDVLGGVADSTDLLAAIEGLRPDVVVVDLNMPKLSGIEACRLIRATTPSVRVIVISANDDPDIQKRAFQVGASRFVAKMRAAEDLPTAIQDAVAGTPPTRHDAG